MRPDYVVMIDSPGQEARDEIKQWCSNNVGPPYKCIEYPMPGVPYGIDDTDKDGTWVAYIDNTYVYGNNRPVDTWCFRDSNDATAFILRWGGASIK